MLTFWAGLVSANAGTALSTAAVARAEAKIILRVCFIGRLLFEKRLFN
jgi:hypothetical protein